MSDRPHIVRVVADEARRQLFVRPRHSGAVPQPRVRDEEIGVEFDDGDFIPYADLGYSGDVGFFRLSEGAGATNEAAPYAASGRLIDLGQIVVTAGASRRLTNDEIRDLLDRHAAGDFGDNGEFYDVDVSDEMLRAGPAPIVPSGPANKVNVLTGAGAIVSAYTVRDYRVWVITEAGENRTTLLLFAGPAAGE
jgi:hypothetical protein